jgi:Ca2+-binding EF-hand superfamily protein
MVDFTPESAYKSIDDWGYGFVDQNNLKSFLRNNKYLASEEDCFAIIRRMDCDADSKLKLIEFTDGIKP